MIHCSFVNLLLHDVLSSSNFVYNDRHVSINSLRLFIKFRVYFLLLECLEIYAFRNQLQPIYKISTTL